jgi:transcriptional regulator
MYSPPHFVEDRDEELRRIIDQYPLGTLVTQGPDGLDANLLPFEFDAADGAAGTLRAHVARANPLWQQTKPDDEVLVIFRASDAYVSPNWYPSKPETHRHVPTWNYQVVQIHGRLVVRDDERYLRGVLARLTRTHEGRTGDPKPWKMTDSAPEFIDSLLRVIVGIEIPVTRIVGKSKLSQNREERDRLGAIDQLRRREQHALSDAMIDHMPRKG